MLTTVLRLMVPKMASVARTSPVTMQRRSVLTLKDHKYTAHATASGAGWNGDVVSNEDGAAPLDLNMSTPKAMGGSGKGQNPEQLFAVGYAACFLGALQSTALRAGKKDLIAGAIIHTSVHLGEQTNKPDFGFAVDIEVEGVEDARLIQEAHAFCPYSRALSLGAQVTVRRK